MFSQERDTNRFSWNDIGDTAAGRPNLGQLVPVTVYRLFQYTLRDVLITQFDVATANRILAESGRLAGKAFCENLLDRSLSLNQFIAQLQERLKTLKIGLLRMERIDTATLEMTITVAEDLDCSGLPVSDETVCDYDEGFIAGILEIYTGKPFIVKEIDCWATGDRVCRFFARPEDEDDDEK